MAINSTSAHQDDDDNDENDDDDDNSIPKGESAELAATSDPSSSALERHEKEENKERKKRRMEGRKEGRKDQITVSFMVS